MRNPTSSLYQIHNSSHLVISADQGISYFMKHSNTYIFDKVHLPTLYTYI